MKENRLTLKTVCFITVIFMFSLSECLYSQNGCIFATDDCYSNDSLWYFVGSNQGAYPNGMKKFLNFRYGSVNVCGNDIMSINSWNGSSWSCGYSGDFSSYVMASRPVSTIGWEKIYIVYDWKGTMSNGNNDYGAIGYSEGGNVFRFDTQLSGSSTWVRNVVYDLSSKPNVNNNASFKIAVYFIGNARNPSTPPPSQNIPFQVDNLKIFGTPITPAATFDSFTYNCGNTIIPASTNTAPRVQKWYWQGTNPNGTSLANNTRSPYSVTSPGTYYIRAYANGTWSVNSQAITVDVVPTPVASVTSYRDVSCYGGSNGQITLSASGGAGYGYTYSVNGIAFQRSKSWTTLSADTYSNIKVKDDIGCVSINSVSQTISQPASAVTGNAIGYNTSCDSCSDGIISFSNASGGWGAAYQVFITGKSWRNLINIYQFTGLAPGIYTAQIRDGCHTECITTIGDIIITSPGQPSTSVSSYSDSLYYNNSSVNITEYISTNGDSVEILKSLFNSIDSSENCNELRIFGFAHSIYIESSRPLVGYLEVFNITGQVVASAKLETVNSYKLKISGEYDGYYIVKIVSDKCIITKKVYIE